MDTMHSGYLWAKFMFQPRKSMAGALEPGDATHYEFVVVEMWDTYEVVVLNDDFFDKIIFLKRNPEKPYKSHRGLHFEGEPQNYGKTNPWTIKAAAQFLDMYIQENKP